MYEELMRKLKRWLLTNWNENNSKFEVTLNATDKSKTTYTITPESEPDYILMSFKEIDATTPYQVDIQIDNCKTYFMGVVRFQAFYDSVHNVLRASLKEIKSQEEVIEETYDDSPRMRM